MLELQNISYLVDDDNKEILRDINLAFDEKFVAITGPNGSGKSTLAKIIAGILKPTSGKILLDGEDITDLSITERANKGISSVSYTHLDVYKRQVKSTGFFPAFP